MIREACVNRTIIALIAVLFLSSGLASAANEYKGSAQSDFGRKTVNTVTDTTKSAVTGTESIVKTSASDTIAAPGAAIQSVKDTANTALKGTDAALKVLTGEDRQ